MWAQSSQWSCRLSATFIFGLPAGQQHITMIEQEMHQRFELRRQPCSISLWWCHPCVCVCVCVVSRGVVIKHPEMCVMLHVSTWWQSAPWHSHPPNRAPLLSTFLPPFIPSLLFPTLLYLTQTPFLLFFLLLLLLLASFCSFVPLWHIPRPRHREGEGEKRGRKGWERKGGKKVGMLAMLLRVIFYFIVVGEREEWVSKERVGGSNRKWQRWRGWEQPDNGGHICKERLSHLSHVSSALVCPFLGNFIWLIFISSSPDDSLPSFSLYSAASLHFLLLWTSTLLVFHAIFIHFHNWMTFSKDFLLESSTDIFNFSHLLLQ